MLNFQAPYLIRLNNFCFLLPCQRVRIIMLSILSQPLVKNNLQCKGGLTLRFSSKCNLSLYLWILIFFGGVWDRKLVYLGKYNFKKNIDKYYNHILFRPWRMCLNSVAVKTRSRDPARNIWSGERNPDLPARDVKNRVKTRDNQTGQNSTKCWLFIANNWNDSNKLHQWWRNLCNLCLQIWSPSSHIT